MIELFNTALLVGAGLGTGFAVVIAVCQFLIALIELLDDWLTKDRD